MVLLAYHGRLFSSGHGSDGFHYFNSQGRLCDGCVALQGASGVCPCFFVDVLDGFDVCPRLFVPVMLKVRCSPGCCHVSWFRLILDVYCC